MFTHLIFLILVLLLINFSSEFAPPEWIDTPWQAFGWGLLLYAATLGLIYLQNRQRKAPRGFLITLANFELLLFLALFLFVLGGQRVLNTLPFVSGSQLAPALFAFFLYLFGLGFSHYTLAQRQGHDEPFTDSTQQLRLILPFALPFLLFLLLTDLVSLIPNERIQQILNGENDLLLIVASLSFMGLMLLFLPPLVVRIWQCVPMEESPLKQRLEQLCVKANFKHAGMLDWTILNRSHTAAILGVLPTLRYILFTKRLQEDLPPEAIEAILAHEIGHSYRKHLLIFPLILLGMIVCVSMYAFYAGPILEAWFEKHSSFEWSLVYPFALFIPYALIIWLYFRYVFGFFSRQFERQADLHIFNLHLPPENMIRALDQVAIATGFTHLVPNWHHFSIQERMNFLQQASTNTQLISQHHRKVMWYLIGYLLLLILCLGWLFYLTLWRGS